MTHGGCSPHCPSFFWVRVGKEVWRDRARRVWKPEGHHESAPTSVRRSPECACLLGHCCPHPPWLGSRGRGPPRPAGQAPVFLPFRSSSPEQRGQRTEIFVAHALVCWTANGGKGRECEPRVLGGPVLATPLRHLRPRRPFLQIVVGARGVPHRTPSFRALHARGTAYAQTVADV